MTVIIQTSAREVLDSRGYPTVEVEVRTANAIGRAVVPSGASTGQHEALELRDKDPKRYGGKGVLSAVQHVNTVIRERIAGMSVTDQGGIDAALIALDGTPDKSKLGANALLGVSLACMRAAAEESDTALFRYIGSIAGSPSFRLPTPMMNIINGGKHADSGLDIQEFMIMPAGLPTFRKSLRAGAEVFHALKGILATEKLTTAVGDEGGFAPNLRTNREAIELLLQAIDVAGYRAGKDIYIALDVAASEMGNETDGYRLEGTTVTSEALIAYYEQLAGAYPIISIEDGLAEDDWRGWQLLTTRLGARLQLVGDDLFVTNAKRLERGIAESAGNAILIKLNQIGTVSETIDTMLRARSAQWNTIVSHRSGETEDTTIADVAVGTAAGQIKTGSLCRSERVAKYNQLLRIEEALGPEAVYSGTEPFQFLRS